MEIAKDMLNTIVVYVIFFFIYVYNVLQKPDVEKECCIVYFV